MFTRSTVTEELQTGLNLNSTLPMMCNFLLVGSMDVQSPERPLRGEVPNPELVADVMYSAQVSSRIPDEHVLVHP